MTEVRDPATTDDDALETLLASAHRSSIAFGTSPSAVRAGLLRQIADDLEHDAPHLIPIAMAEAHLPEARPVGELARTTFQLRLFAEVVERGEYLDVVIDHPNAEWGPVGRPDLRRMLVPLGPVVVFGASNFPFAFGVSGGDTAAALAAGCPVLCKAHPGHLRLSEALGATISGAVATCGLDAGIFSVLFGDEPGRASVLDPRIRAVAFTGSLGGGRALFDLATSRPTPIPFFGELGSVNPVFVTRTAITERRAEIATGFVGSYTLGVGQYCTKPGVLFYPSGTGIVEEIAHLAAEVPPAPMLNGHIARGFASGRDRLADDGRAEVVVPGGGDDAGMRASLFATTLAHVLEDPDELLAECFGPASLLVEVEDDAALLRAVELFDGELTATVHGTEEDPLAGELLRACARIAGRVVWNGWPTGIAVSWAMHHGGPYPATTNVAHTSVGPAAIARFLRPVTFQSVPDALLPSPLADRNPLGVARTVDGTKILG
jgi:NADP-dependent aldehyde dehydrogenase